MKACLVNYNFDPTWLKDYPELEVTIYDRSDDGIERNLTQYGAVYKTANIGNVDRDKVAYLIENYDTLPDAFLWGKTNLLKYVDEEQLRSAIKEAKFAPLLKLSHKTYADPDGNVVCFYQNGLYHERYGIANTLHKVLPWKYFKEIQEFWQAFNIKQVGYIPFPPGGNFILTREAVHKYSRDFYRDLQAILEYTETPLEAQFLERSYYLLWK